MTPLSESNPLIIMWGDVHMKKKKAKKSKKTNVKRNPFIKWRNVKIGKKYLVSFVLSAILFIVAGVVVYTQLSSTEIGINHMEDKSKQATNMAQAASLIQTKDSQVSSYLLTNDDKHVDQFKEADEELSDILTTLESQLIDNREQTLFSKVKENNEDINDIFLNQMVPAIDDENEGELLFLQIQSGSLRKATVNLANELIEIANKDQNAAITSANEGIDKSIVVLLTVNTAAIVIGLMVMIFISRGVTSHLKKVVGVTTELANGNLAVESLDNRGQDEIGQLSEAVNHMKENIRNILFKVSHASSSVSANSEELTQSAHEVKEGNEQIAVTMQELASGAESQATSASNISEQMNELVNTIRTSERNGQDIVDVSDETIELTKQGTALMRQSIEQMEKIDAIVSESVKKVQGLDKQSDEISSLVLVIKDIADQTNLLSLNAAIEAARAGEHGQGFAVVADEVKKLSGQVTTSISEITTIVTNIQTETDHVVESLNEGYSEVKEGTVQIEKTGASFEKIERSVSGMVSNIISISNNLKDVAKNSQDMNHLIENIASVSEESAAGVEQSAASSQETSSSMDEVASSAVELAKLAEQLNDEIKVFKL